MKTNNKGKTCMAVIFLQWNENNDTEHLAAAKKETSKPSPESAVSRHECPPLPPSEANPELRASWRVPRPDGQLRPADRLVLRYLRSIVLTPGGNTTETVAMREISVACELSHRTAQNALRRLSLQQLVAPLTHASGSNEGRRYRLSGTISEEDETSAVSKGSRRH
jgi:hypothetical protein